MNKKQFDNFIRDNLMAHSANAQLGYVIPGESMRDTYYSESAFDAFQAEMKKSYPSAFTAYGNGKGSELEVRSVCGHRYPPKMASVASSSRFCYLALRGLKDTATFEQECPIMDVNGKRIPGTAPQLDAYIPDQNIYIEVKCHEIFDSHIVILPNAYKTWLCSDFGISEDKIFQEGGKLKVALEEFGIFKNSSRFDIKQLLCHLMGIASQKSDAVELAYLFFWPSGSRDVDAVFLDLQNEISAIFTSPHITRFCQKHAIRLSAWAEKTPTMESLTCGNNVRLF